MTMQKWIPPLLGYLRAAPEIIALGAEVGTARPADVRITRVGGGTDDWVGQMEPTIQLACYGHGEGFTTKQRLAQDLFDAAHAWLMDPSGARGRLITAAGVNVLVVGCLTANLEQVEADTEAVAVLGRYRLRVFGAAA